MARTAQITLDDKVFTVHALNMGELDEVFELFDGPTRKVARGVLAIAMRRAEPKLNGAFDALEPTLDRSRHARGTGSFRTS